MTKVHYRLQYVQHFHIPDVQSSRTTVQVLLDSPCYVESVSPWDLTYYGALPVEKKRIPSTVVDG